ncbi:MAG TPA: ADP-ribosylglycohydrolase family protein [Gemmatimonadales bacterium]|nr:ADP-ribosylglycohydrolase family protein [Gemmatimonadales bacterium]
MPSPTPDSRRRSRGATLGHALGTLLTPAGEVDPAGPRQIELRLASILTEELTAPEVDIHRLATRWAELANPGDGLDLWTRAALAHIRTHDAPPARLGAGASPAVLGRTLPLTLRTLAAPANLVSGTYHLTTLTHPDEEFGWAAVAVQFAVSILVQGRRDFLPDTLAVLRNNSAPESLLQPLRRIPTLAREELPATADGAVSGALIALWLAHHEPDLERGLTWLADPRQLPVAGVAGSLFGARDGEGAFPARWVSRISSELRG